MGEAVERRQMGRGTMVELGGVLVVGSLGGLNGRVGGSGW